MIDVLSCLPERSLLRDWLRYHEAFESPPSYYLFALLTVAGAAIEGSLLVNPDSEPEVRTNLYTLLYGPSGVRKGRPVRQALRLLHDAAPDTRLIPASFSVEYLRHYLAEQSFEADKSGGLLANEEFTEVIGTKDYQRDSLFFLSKLWDCPVVSPHGTLARKLEIIRNPYLSILSASNPSWIEQAPAGTLEGGALRRLLIVAEWRPRSLVEASPKRGEESLYLDISERAKVRLGVAAERERGMPLSRAARARADAWYIGLAERRGLASEQEGFFLNSAQAQMYKLAAIVHVLEGGSPAELDEPAVAVGIALTEALMGPMFQVYAGLVPTIYARHRASVMRIVGSGGEDGVTTGECDRRVVRTCGIKMSEAGAIRQELVNEGALRVGADGRLRV